MLTPRPEAIVVTSAPVSLKPVTRWLPHQAVDVSLWGKPEWRELRTLVARIGNISAAPGARDCAGSIGAAGAALPLMSRSRTVGQRSARLNRLRPAAERRTGSKPATLSSRLRRAIVASIGTGGTGVTCVSCGTSEALVS